MEDKEIVLTRFGLSDKYGTDILAFCISFGKAFLTFSLLFGKNQYFFRLGHRMDQADVD